MIDSVLVIGGGIAGLTAARAVARTGAKAVLVERGAILGGRMAARLGEDRDSAALLNGVDVPRARAVLEDGNIEVLTLSELVELKGEPGHFSATIRQRARYVTDDCTQCNKCRLVCPVVLPNDYEAGLAFRKAIYSPLRDGAPEAYVVDIEHCLNEPPNYLPCQRCVEVCEPDCILFGMKPDEEFQRDVGAVVVAVGYDVADPAQLRKFGYGTHPDVVTSLELERLLTPTGPTGGYVEKPSNEENPESLLLVITESTALSWIYSLSQVSRLVEQDVSDITILYDSGRDNGNHVKQFGQQALDMGAKLVHGTVKKVHGDTHNVLHVQYTDLENDQKITQEFDLIALASAVKPSAGLSDLAETLAIDLQEEGFVRASESAHGFIATTREGICVVGCAAGPSSIEDTYAGGEAAAAAITGIAEGPKLGEPPAKKPSGNGSAGALALGTGLTESELQERLEKFLWSLVALGQSDANATAGENR